MAYSLLSYKTGKSFLHKIPAWLKILLIPALNIMLFNLPVYVAAAVILLQFVLACCLRFSLKEQFSDLFPVIFYGILLYLTSFIAQFCSFFCGEHTDGFVGAVISAGKQVFTNLTTLFILIKLFCIMQGTSLVFRTSTSLEIREGFAVIEIFFRRLFHLSRKTPVANTISLFVCFIPMVFRLWNQSVRAWKARQGKVNIRMFLTLLPVLFSVGMKNAWNSARAMAIRS